MEYNDLANLEKVSIKDIPNINEKWIQDYIANDPSVLGLGDIEFKSKEKVQPSGGRLDILLQDSENSIRYEVELQLGKTDESHIIRTIEYWDIERKRYQNYDHCAVIIAEDLSSRFFNIIQLFNGFIPLIAIKMKAYKINGKIAITFDRVLDRIKPGEDDDEDETLVDKSYWEKRASKESTEMASEICKLINEIENSYVIQYNKCSVLIAKNGTPNRFIKMYPKKTFLRIDFVLEKNEDNDNFIEENEIESLDYNIRRGKYKIRISNKDFLNKKTAIKTLLEKSYEEYNK